MVQVIAGSLLGAETLSVWTNVDWYYGKLDHLEKKQWNSNQNYNNSSNHNRNNYNNDDDNNSDDGDDDNNNINYS